MKKKLWLYVSAFVVVAVSVYVAVGMIFFWGNQSRLGADSGRLANAIYIVDFDSHGGTAIDSQSVRAGETAKKPEDPKRTGYEFKGWESNGKPFEFTTPITGNLRLSAQWDPKFYDVTFNTCGGDALASRSVAHGSKLEPPTPVCDGLEFLGWYRDPGYSQPFNVNAIITSDLTLYAKWSIEFEEIGSSYAIVKYNGNANAVTLPSVYNGKPVTMICAFAFENCATATSIIIPDSITTIELCAFYGCSNLTTVVIPSSVTEMGRCVFQSCSALECIYCQMPDPSPSSPAGWDDRWNEIRRNYSVLVTWDYH